MTQSLFVQYWKALGYIAAALIILGYLTYSFVAPGGRFSDVQNDLKAIKPTEEQAYTDLDGNTINLKDFADKPLIINSWATWMPFSQSELPLLREAREEHGETIAIVAMNRMESAAVVRSYLETIGVAGGLLVITLDPSDNFYKAVGGYSMPETLFYSEEGVLVEHFRGVLSKEYLDEMIDVLLK